MAEREGKCTRCHKPVLSQLAFTLCIECQLADEDIPVPLALSQHLEHKVVDDSKLGVGGGVELATDKDRFGLMFTEEEMTIAATQDQSVFKAAGYFRRKFSQAKQAFEEASGVIGKIKLPDRSNTKRVFKD